MEPDPTGVHGTLTSCLSYETTISRPRLRARSRRSQHSPGQPSLQPVMLASVTLTLAAWLHPSPSAKMIRAPAPAMQNDYDPTTYNPEVAGLAVNQGSLDGRPEGAHGTGYRFMPLSTITRESSPAVAHGCRQGWRLELHCRAARWARARGLRLEERPRGARRRKAIFSDLEHF